jgi:hypothetical protein
VAVALTATVQAQSASYSATEVYLYSGKEYAKVWSQADPGNIKSRSERIDEKTGEKYITIIRQDSAKIYTLNPAKKTYSAISLSTMQNLPAAIGLKETNREVSKEFLGVEKLKNGYECHHYIDHTTTTINGNTETGCFEYWLYEPLGVQMQHKIACGYDEPIILMNFQQGAQPAHLFEIPKDYKDTSANLNDVKKEMEKIQNIQDMLKQQMNKK